MKVIIDIYHPADVNFYKNAIKELIDRGNEVDLIVRPRGKLVSILQKELPDVHCKIIGKHLSTIVGKVSGYIEREIELLLYLKNLNFDIGTGFGSQICYASKILGKPSVAFDDDFEYKLPFYLSKLSATRYVMPEYIPSSGRNIYKYNGLKELAHLHPKYFKPNKRVLEPYELKPNEYIFIREIANTSLNYNGIIPNLHEITHHLKKLDFKIIVSLEDKSLKEGFGENCIILKEPVEDIYSLLSFAALTISSGDTMARESCLVGTPSIYTSNRNMSVNKMLIESGCMFKVDGIVNIQNAIDYIIENEKKKEVIEIINYNLKYKWCNTTDIIVKSLIEVFNKN